MRLGTPVHHHLQVTEVAHAEAALTAQGEDGNHGAGTLPHRDREPGLWQFIHHHLSLYQFRLLQDTVLTVLPDHGQCLLAVQRQYHELIFRALRQTVGIQTHHPLMTFMFGHGQRLGTVPATQVIRRAHQGQPLTVAQLWCTHLQADGMVVFCLGAQLAFACHHTVREGRRIHITVLWHVQPVVVHGIVSPFHGCQFQSVRFYQPLMAHLFLAAHHAVIIVHIGTTILQAFHLHLPVQAVEALHRVAVQMSVLIQEVQCHVLTESRAVFQVKL